MYRCKEQQIVCMQFACCAALKHQQQSSTVIGTHPYCALPLTEQLVMLIHTCLCLVLIPDVSLPHNPTMPHTFKHCVSQPSRNPTHGYIHYVSHTLSPSGTPNSVPCIIPIRCQLQQQAATNLGEFINFTRPCSKQLCQRTPDSATPHSLHSIYGCMNEVCNVAPQHLPLIISECMIGLRGHGQHW